jgi:hypothetical protein
VFVCAAVSSLSSLIKSFESNSCAPTTDPPGQIGVCKGPGLSRFSSGFHTTALHGTCVANFALKGPSNVLLSLVDMLACWVESKLLVGVKVG